MLRSLPSRLLAVTFILLSDEAFIVSAHADTKSFETNFKSLSPGPLVNQGHWQAVKNTSSPIVINDPERGLVAGCDPEPEAPTGSSSAMFPLQDFSIKPGSVLEIVFDICHNGEGPGMAAVALGNESMFGKSNAYVGMIGNRWRINDKEALNAAGKSIYPPADQWFRVKCIMTLPSDNNMGTATLEIMNLSQGETEYKPVYFDAAQKENSVELDYTPRNDRDWKFLGVRLNVGKTETSTRTGAIDTISIKTLK